MKMARAIYRSPGALGTLLACLVLAGAANSQAGRIPVLEGPAVRLDFGRSFIDDWRGPATADFVTVSVPRREGLGWPGATDPAAWENSAVLGPLVREEPETEFRAFFTGEGLFFRARNRFDPAHPPRAAMRERNTYVSGEDLVEIRLRRPAGNAGENPLYHFIVNAAGALYDSRDGRTGYNARWHSLVETGNDAWTLWIMIPFGALELDGPVPELEINIGRNGVIAQALSWGPDWSETAHRRIALEGVTGGENPGAAASGADGNGIGHTRSGKGISLEWVSGSARPQDRWIEGTARVDAGLAGRDAEVEIILRETGRMTALKTVRAAAERSRGRLMVDLRRLGLDSALVTATLYSGGVKTGSASSFITARPLPPAPENGFRIPLLVSLPDGPSPEGEWPLHAGVPFPAGLLWEATGWVVEDEAGNAYPTRLEASGLWSLEGSIQWLRVDTVADPRAPLFLVHRPGAMPGPVENPVRIERNGENLVLSNGLAEYVLSADHSPVLSVRRGGREVAGTAGTRGLYLVDQRGRTATVSAEGAELLIEAGGPVAGCVRIEGDYRTEGGEALARHITRVELSAGMPFARVTHTLVLTRDTRETWFREIGWEFELAEGGAPAAFFGISREDPGEFRRVDDPRDTYLVQESYYRFGAGEKRFRLARGEEEILAGEEMGDWFLARNDSASLLLACRESARQHPKEFAVDGRLVNLMLFSPRAGEELDFRAETLVEKWNLRNWITNDRWDELSPERRAEVEEEIDRAREVQSNALGWAKTHEILFAPGTGAREPGEAAALSAWHSRPVFALADPAWLNRTRAMGPLHPRDPERFPEAERLVDAALGWFTSLVPLTGEWGFVDYYAGPHFHNPGAKYPRDVRYRLTYTLRPDAWRVYARSGLREAYDFATATNRSWGDNHLASWDSGRRIRGLFTDFSGRGSELPFYWGDRTALNLSGTTNLNQFAWDYHLTGYRRAGDQVRDFAAGIKEFLTPREMARDGRIIMTFRTLMQSYGFTWDRDLLDLAGAAADYFEDPESAVGLTINRPYDSSTYKTRTDWRAIQEAWALTGNPRYRRLALTLGRYIWDSFIGESPLGYTNPTGPLGHFLHEETGDPAIAQEMLAQMRWASSRYNPRAAHGGITPGPHVSDIFEGIPMIQEVVARTGADRRPPAAWVGARDFGNPLSFALDKPDAAGVRFSLSTPEAEAISVGGPRLKLLDARTTYGPELISVFQQRSKAQTGNILTRWNLPVDVPAGPAEITPAAFGRHYGILGGPGRLVLHAPGYWAPFPAQEPAVPWFFMVPADAREPAVFLESMADLFTPEGELWREATRESAWVELPPDKPGLWSFVPRENRLVRVRNLPPFFAAERAESWFDPGLDWTPEPEREPFEPPAETGFTDGVSGAPGDRSLYVSPTGSFAFEGGEPLGEAGSGTDFLPFREGTIEFWMRPAWSSFDFPRERAHWQHILHLETDSSPWTLSHIMDYATPHDMWTHSLHASTFGERDGRRMSFRTWRRFTVLEPGEWVHLAMTWGPTTRRGPRGLVEGQVFRIYLDGRAGSTTGHFAEPPALMPRRLVLPGAEAAFAHLRVSDIMRYEDDFEPPSRTAVPSVDGHTRAYFSFDGTLKGVSGDGRTVDGRVTP